MEEKNNDKLRKAEFTDDDGGKVMDKKHLDQLTNSVKLAEKPKMDKLFWHPKRMITSKLLQGIAHLLNRSFQVKTNLFWGDNIIIVIPEVVSLHILRYGYFEEGLTRMVLEYLRPGMTFFDIGAHFGYYTLLASHIIGRKGQVHSFEPVPSTFEVLQRNAAKKNNVVLNNCAVFSENGIIALNDYGIEYCAFDSITKARLDEKILQKVRPCKVEVKAITLDEYIQRAHVCPDFIKIDAESAEYEILRGMNKILTDIRPIISLEVGDMNIKNIVPTKDLILYMLEQGYESYEYSYVDKRLIKHVLKARYTYDNFLFLPKSKG